MTSREHKHQCGNVQRDDQHASIVRARGPIHLARAVWRYQERNGREAEHRKDQGFSPVIQDEYQRQCFIGSADLRQLPLRMRSYRGDTSGPPRHAGGGGHADERPGQEHGAPSDETCRTAGRFVRGERADHGPALPGWESMTPAINDPVMVRVPLMLSLVLSALWPSVALGAMR